MPSQRWVETSGLHALLRASGLPREELLHYGADPALLSSSAPTFTPAETAAPLLGRIVWDAVFGDAYGRAYVHGPLRATLCIQLGNRVIAEWFS